MQLEVQEKVTSFVTTCVTRITINRNKPLHHNAMLSYNTTKDYADSCRGIIPPRPGSGPSDRKIVKVRVFSWALTANLRLARNCVGFAVLFLACVLGSRN